MGKPLVDVSASGAIILGGKITCDGFLDSHKIRVQTHVHQDHMGGFFSSLGGGREVIVSPGTYKLLRAKYPELDIRTNIHQLDSDGYLDVAGFRITLISSDHLLGGVQVVVEDLKTGSKLGYSSDFSWPLAKIIKVDELVVDATYGNPRAIRQFTQDAAEGAFIQLVKEGLRGGPVHIIAMTGPAERSMVVLENDGICDQFPVIGSEDLCRNVEVWRECNYKLPKVIKLGTKAAERLMNKNRYIRYWGYGHGQPNDAVDGISITLKAKNYETPVKPMGRREYCVGLTNHADFNGTIKYVAQTGAKYVVTDGCRSPDSAEKLAKQIGRRLGTNAKVSSNKGSQAWGE